MTETINLRLSETEKAAIRAAAETSGKTLTEYILDTLASVGGWEREPLKEGRPFRKSDILDVLRYADKYDPIQECYIWAEMKAASDKVLVGTAGEELLSAAVTHCVAQNYVQQNGSKIRLLEAGELYLYSNSPAALPGI